jgi:hypothetical protein
MRFFSPRFIIYRLLGLMLLVASILKAYQVVFDPASVVGYRWISIVEIQLEVMLALWLIIGWYANHLFKVAFVVFTALAAVALGKTILGDTSCGCFGLLETRPIYVFGFDLCAVSALWCTRPNLDISNATTCIPVKLLHLTSYRNACAFALGILIFTAGLGFRLAYTPSNADVEALTIHTPRHDFGVIQRGAAATHRFTLANDGTAPIELVSFQSTCACTTTINLAGTVIGPSESIEMPVTLKTGYTDGRASGVVTVYYRLTGHGGNLPWKSVEVSGNTRTDYLVRPRLIDFGSVAETAPITKTVRLRPDSLPNVKIERLRVDNPAFEAHVTKTPAEGLDYWIEVSVHADRVSSDGPVSATLAIHTSSKQLPTTIVYLQAYCRTWGDYSPTAIVIPSIVPGSQRKKILFRLKGGAKVLSVQCQHSSVKPTFREDSPNECQVEVEIDDPGSGHQITTDLIVNIARMNGTSQIVSIPIHRLASR